MLTRSQRFSGSERMKVVFLSIPTGRLYLCILLNCSLYLISYYMVIYDMICYYMMIIFWLQYFFFCSSYFFESIVYHISLHFPKIRVLLFFILFFIIWCLHILDHPSSSLCVCWKINSYWNMNE